MNKSKIARAINVEMPLNNAEHVNSMLYTPAFVQLAADMPKIESAEIKSLTPGFEFVKSELSVSTGDTPWYALHQKLDESKLVDWDEDPAIAFHRRQSLLTTNSKDV